MYEYKAQVKNVVDSDTIDCIVDLGFRMTADMRFRIRNFDGPESYRPKSEGERKHAQEADERARWLLLGKEVTIKTFKQDKYGRYLADIIVDGEDYATIMIAEGYSKRDSY